MISPAMACRVRVKPESVVIADASVLPLIQTLRSKASAWQRRPAAGCGVVGNGISKPGFSGESIVEKLAN